MFHVISKTRLAIVYKLIWAPCARVEYFPGFLFSPLKCTDRADAHTSITVAIIAHLIIIDTPQAAIKQCW